MEGNIAVEVDLLASRCTLNSIKNAIANALLSLKNPPYCIIFVVIITSTA